MTFWKAATSMRGRSHLIRNATIAALVGGTAGAFAGLWSVRDQASSAALSPMSTGGDVAASSASPPKDAASGELGRDLTARHGLVSSSAVAAVLQPVAPAAAVRLGTAQNDSLNVLQRARAFAEVPDVYALVALRESISRVEQDSPPTQELLREIDRYLAKARQLRLKLDGEALRRDQAANPPRRER
jgi:hypothetical protein